MIEGIALLHCCNECSRPQVEVGVGSIVVVLRTEAEDTCELDKETQVKLGCVFCRCCFQG